MNACSRAEPQSNPDARCEILYCDWASNQCLWYPATTSVQAEINLIRTFRIVLNRNADLSDKCLHFRGKGHGHKKLRIGRIRTVDRSSSVVVVDLPLVPKLLKSIVSPRESAQGLLSPPAAQMAVELSLVEFVPKEWGCISRASRVPRWISQPASNLREKGLDYITR